MDQLRIFRGIALAEATSFLLLLLATVLKYSAGMPIGVKVLGPIHGSLFVVYGALALLLRSPMGWGFWKTVAILFGAVLPFGGYIVDVKVLRNAEPQAAL